MPSLFAPKVSDNKANPLFLATRDRPAYSAARELMDHIFESYVDKDKNFVRDFQTTGFSARVWELSLFAFLQESNVDLNTSYPAPDYVVAGSVPVAIEAATSQPSQDTKPEAPSPAYWGVIPEDLEEDEREFTFQIAKSLRRKMLHKHDGESYWNLKHVQGLPFVLAVEAFHKTSSLFYSTSYAAQYLYGFQPTSARDAGGRLMIRNKRLDVHGWKGKEIPSGFFSLPESENVSAVIFSNAGTVPQFARIGQQLNLGASHPILLRTGICVDPDPDAELPQKFAYIVGDPGSPEEDFAQAIHVMHNPNAKIPLPVGVFPNVTEHIIDPASGLLESTHRDFSPFASLTAIFERQDQRANAEERREAFLRD